VLIGICGNAMRGIFDEKEIRDNIGNLLNSNYFLHLENGKLRIRW